MPEAGALPVGAECEVGCGESGAASGSWEFGTGPGELGAELAKAVEYHFSSAHLLESEIFGQQPPRAEEGLVSEMMSTPWPLNC